MSSVYTTGSLAEMLAIPNIQKDDICVRTDISKTFKNGTGENKSINDWIALLSPASIINGITGSSNNISLSAENKGLGNIKLTAEMITTTTEDILEFSSKDLFPLSGSKSKIYVDLLTNKTWRWSGTTYIEVSPSEVISVNGKIGIVNLTPTDIGLGSVQNTADSTKSVLTATKLTVPRTFTYTGDATGSGSFDGTANISVALTLPASGVTSGSYGANISIPVLTVDSKGRITAASTTSVRAASTSTTGVVQLNDTLTSTSLTLAATANSVRTLYNYVTTTGSAKWSTARTLSLTGGVTGSVSIDGSANVNIPTTLNKQEIATQTVYSTSDSNLSFLNGTQQVLTLTSNSVLAADIANGQSITVYIPASGFNLDLSAFTIANNFISISSTTLNTLLLINIAGTKYLYGINRG